MDTMSRTGDQVEVASGDDGALAVHMVGTVAAPPDLVHTIVVARLDPRLIASLAEGWVVGSRPDWRLFSLIAGSSGDEAPGLRFRLVDDRGEMTRRRNWVAEVEGSWRFDPLADGAASRVTFQATIRYARSVSPWAIRAAASHDLAMLMQTLRDRVGDQGHDHPVRKSA
jgi:hypothetical protein